MASIGFDYKRSLYGSNVSPNDVDYEKNKKECHKRSADKMLKLCQDNGGCFIKVCIKKLIKFYIILNKTYVLHYPLGQVHSPASSDHYFHLKIVLFRTLCVKTVIRL